MSLMTSSGSSYLVFQTLDLHPLVVELVTLLPHSSQKFSEALLLALDHPLRVILDQIDGPIITGSHLFQQINRGLLDFFLFFIF